MAFKTATCNNVTNETLKIKIFNEVKLIFFRCAKQMKPLIPSGWGTSLYQFNKLCMLDPTFSWVDGDNVDTVHYSERGSPARSEL